MHRIFTIALLMLFAGIAPVLALNNGVALTPPMGYNSWYGNGSGITEALIHSVADEMATNGMLAAGYNYITLDDGWMGVRDTNGAMIADTVKFPHGMKNLADYVHAKGFKLGLYTVFGTNTCANLAGSADHIVQDANTYAAWGIDFLKFEGCSLPLYEILPRQQIYILRLQQALANTGRSFLVSASIANNFENWMPRALNLWRGTGDEFRIWDIILHHIDFVAQSPSAAGAGGWNDPDVLMIGNNYFNAEQNKTIFSMWCELAAPLLTPVPGTGNTNIFCNRDAIAVDQDSAGIQGVCLNPNSNLQVWSKPLGGTNSPVRAVVLFNRSGSPASIATPWESLGIPNGVATVWDIWANAYRGCFTNAYSDVVNKDGVAFLRITADSTLPQPAAGTNYLSDLPWMADSTSSIAFTGNAPLNRDLSAAQTTLRLRGSNYSKGFGTLAPSRTSFFLGGLTGHFKADVGLDDAALNQGAVTFSVYLDGNKVFESGSMTTATPTQALDLDVSGHMILTLVTSNALPGNVNDYADWAGARLIVTPTPPTIPTTLTAVSSTSGIDLHWVLAFGATNYLIKRATSPGGPYTVVGYSTNASYHDSVAAAGTSYFYVITAANAQGESAASNESAGSIEAQWISTNAATAQSWAINSNWTNTPAYPNAIGFSAAINSAILSNQTILLPTAINLGTLTLGAPTGAASFKIASDGGELQLNNGLSPARIFQTASSQGDEIASPMLLSTNLIADNRSIHPLTFSGSIRGTGGLTCVGSGVISLSGSNSYSGLTTVTNGTLRILSASALGLSSNSAAILQGGTLDLAGNSLGSHSVLAAGAGNSNSGVIINSSSNATGTLQNLTLTAASTLGGDFDWEVRGSVSNAPSGIFSTTGNAWTLTKTGSNQITLADAAVDAALGDVLVSNGILALQGATTTLGNPSSALTVQVGATLLLKNTASLWNKHFHLYCDGVTASLVSLSGSNTISGSVSLEDTSIIDVSGGYLNLAGAILGSGGIIKQSPGRLVLSGASGCAGLLDVVSGSVSIQNSNCASSIAQMHIGSAGVLDFSALPFGVTLGGSQIVYGEGAISGNVIADQQTRISCTNATSVLTFSNSLAFTEGSTCILGMDIQAHTNTQLKVLGTLSLGGTLNLVVAPVGSLTTNSAFKLFNASNITGGFAAIQPKTPGSNLLWNTSTINTDGVLRVASGLLPYFKTFSMVNGDLRLVGAGGKANGVFYLLSSTNLQLPSLQWKRIATNSFDATGNFSISNLVSSNSPACFFQLLTP